MFAHDHPLNRLIDEIKKIPGIGAKSAQRIALYFIGLPEEESVHLPNAIKEAKSKIFYCSTCNSLTHLDPCQYCTDDSYSDASLCIVEEPFNITAVEKTGVYKGKYHVLLGVLSPLKGIGPDELKIDNLMDRIKDGHFTEIIIATNPTVEGEATAHYLVKLLLDSGIRLTRLAMGLPVGSDIDFADQVTIKKSLEGRTEIRE